MAEGSKDPIEEILKELGISGGGGAAGAPAPGQPVPPAAGTQPGAPPAPGPHAGTPLAAGGQLPPKPAAAPPGAPPGGGAFQPLGGDGEEKVERHIDLLMNVGLDVKVELGRTRRMVKDILRLGKGSIVELDKLAGDPLEIFVNDRLVARGEVLVLNDNFCVRITEILGGAREK